MPLGLKIFLLENTKLLTAVKSDNNLNSNPHVVMILFIWVAIIMRKSHTCNWTHLIKYLLDQTCTKRWLVLSVYAHKYLQKPSALIQTQELEGLCIQKLHWEHCVLPIRQTQCPAASVLVMICGVAEEQEMLEDQRRGTSVCAVCWGSTSSSCMRADVQVNTQGLHTPVNCHIHFY